MRKPEFLGLLSQYMVEISDPKNKKEYDDWLRQMEKENELPKHMKLIQPKAEFCVKTTLNSIKNKQHEMKFFINMCSSEQIGQPNFEPYTNDRGEIGQNWKIPHSMGKVRYDQDKKGNVCNTVDAVFNPFAFGLASNKPFQAMMISIALETAQRQLGQRKQTLSKDYVILQNVKCKGDQPALLPVRKIDGKLYNKGQGEDRDQDGRQTKLQKEINERKQEHIKQEAQKEQQRKKEEEEQKKLEEELNEETTKKQLQDDKGPSRPKFQSVYSYTVDYGDFIDNKTDTKRKRPSGYAIEFKLPKLDSFGEIQKLDISDSKLILSAGNKYFLDLEFAELKLNFKIIATEGKAKFDKKRKTLRITFPIDKESLKEAEKEQEAPKEEESARQQVQTENVVQTQTWKDKNKLLEVTQNSVSLQFLKKEDIEQPKPKVLVQQIDQDDDMTLKQNLQPVQKKVSNLPVSVAKPITFKFQETDKNAFVSAHLPKYQKGDVTVWVHQDRIIVRWQVRDNKPEYMCLRLTKYDYEKYDVRYVVDYVVIRFDKKTKRFWEKESILEENVDNIEEQITKISKQLEQVRTIVKKEEKKEEPKQIEEEVKEVKEVSKIMSQTTEKTPIPALPQTRIKTIQFLHFSIRLVQSLD